MAQRSMSERVVENRPRRTGEVSSGIREPDSRCGKFRNKSRTHSGNLQWSRSRTFPDRTLDRRAASECQWRIGDRPAPVAHRGTLAAGSRAESSLATARPAECAEEVARVVVRAVGRS